MYSQVLVLIVIFHAVLGLSIEIEPSKVQTGNGCNKKKGCCEKATIVCCDGYVLQVQNETTASCVQCIPAGQSCYQKQQSCCPGYRCGSGPVVYPEPRPTDICISHLIRG